MSELERRQERFCVEFVSDPKRNQTQAAMRAGYSENSARITGSQLMKNPNIINRIKELERQALEESGYSAESIRVFAMRKIISIASTDAADVSMIIYENDKRRLDALKQMANANNGQFLLDFGDPLIYVKPTSDWSPDERAAVKSIKINQKGFIEVELHDKLASLRILADIAGITKNETNLTGSIEVSGGLDISWQDAPNELEGALMRAPLNAE